MNSQDKECSDLRIHGVIPKLYYVILCFHLNFIIKNHFHILIGDSDISQIENMHFLCGFKESLITWSHHSRSDDCKGFGLDFRG